MAIIQHWNSLYAHMSTLNGDELYKCQVIISVQHHVVENNFKNVCDNFVSKFVSEIKNVVSFRDFADGPQ